MDYRNLVKLLLGGSTLRATEHSDYRPVKGITLVWSGTQFFTSPWVKTRIVFPKAYVFKAFKSFREDRLQQVAVDVTKPFTRKVLEEVLNVELVREMRVSRTGRSYCSGLKYHDQKIAARVYGDWSKELFTLRTISLNTFLRARLFESACKIKGVKGTPFPAHPSWITSRRTESIMNGLVSLNGDMFADVAREANGGQPIDDQQINVLRIRAGKDGWSEILGAPDKLRLMVFPEELSINGKLTDGDGIIFVRKATCLSSGKFGLVRGIASLDGERKGIAKGRMLYSPAQASIGPDGCAIPAEFDGWCYDSAIKWQKVNHNGNTSSSIDMVLGLSKEEDHDQKEMYSLNLFYLVLGRWTAETKRDIVALLRNEARHKVANLNDLKGTMYRQLDRGLAESEDDVLIDSYLSKYVLGYLPITDPGVSRALNRRGKALMSAGVPDSVYAAIIHRTHVVVDGGTIYKLQPGEFVPSKSMREAINSGYASFSRRTGEWEVSVAGVRYPNTTKGSFLNLTMSSHTLDDIDGIFTVVSLEAQIGWQSDGDDHALFLPGYKSLIGVMDDFGTIEKSSKPAEGALTPWTACMHGRWCQERTALLVAAYMKCLATIYDHRPDTLDAALKDLLPLAQSIQDSVQGIKKYVGLSVEIDEAYALCDSVLASVLLEDAYSPTSEIIRGKLVDNMDLLADVVRSVYGIHMDTSSIGDVNGKFRAINIEAVVLTSEERVILREAWVLAHRKMVNAHLSVVNHLLLKVVGTNRETLHTHPESIDTLDVSKLERAVVLYGVFVNGLVKKNEISVVRGMNGMACLYAERLLG